MKISYNWIKSYVTDIPEPNRLADLFTYHVCEVESVIPIRTDGSVADPTSNGTADWIFDLGILPNRAHDLLSHQGVAKEISGLLGMPFNDPTPLYKTPASTPTKLQIEINSPNCRRYSGRIVRNIKIGPSPQWMVKHLESIGQRSINNIVDATNIVMYDCGQPCHAFDLAKLRGEKIFIKNAHEGEELKVVGREGIVAKLTSTDLVISDGEKTLALAGVKGGFDSGISDATTDIVLEVANFSPTSVRKTARRLGLLSDSAKRFENDLSPTLCDFGMLALSALITELCPEALFEDVVDVYPNPHIERKLSFTTLHINKYLGIEIQEQEIEKILKNYAYEYSKQGEGKFEILVPPLRLDIQNKEDMVEEIGRIYGYDKVIPTIPKILYTPSVNTTYEKIKHIREILVSNRYSEVITYAFANTGEVEVLASASDKKFMRTNLADGLKKSYELNKLNAPLLSLDEIKIFEIGTVFTSDREEIHIGWNDKTTIKEATLENFEESFLQVLGSPMAQPDHSENLSSKFSSSEVTNTTIFKMWSLYPCIVRDIAVWVPEGINPEILIDIYKEFGTELMHSEPLLVDQFTKKFQNSDEGNRTSYAHRLIFQAIDRTLTTEEINLIMSHITEKITTLGYIVR